MKFDNIYRAKHSVYMYMDRRVGWKSIFQINAPITRRVSLGFFGSLLRIPYVFQRNALDDILFFKIFALKHRFRYLRVGIMQIASKVCVQSVRGVTGTAAAYFDTGRLATVLLPYARGPVIDCG